MCGRYHIDLDAAWDMTPGEFEDLLAGRIEAEREQRLSTALIVSAIAATNGQRIDPLVMIGETEDYGPDPFGPPDPKTVYERAQQRMREAALAKARKQFPQGLKFDDEE